MKLIYHTSHCGSTLLTALLSMVNEETYSEPNIFHSAIKNGVYELNLECFIDNSTIIKIPSGMCHSAIQYDVKKVFLYRSLEEHLVKVFNDPKLSEYYLNYYFEYMFNVKHPLLKGIDFNDDLKKHIFMWANRILWLQDSSNVLWLESKDFFSEMEKNTTKVCNFFEVPTVKNFSIARIDVKKAGLNNINIPVNQIDILPENNVLVGYNHGIIPECVYLEDEEISVGRDWLLSFVPNLKEFCKIKI